MDFNTNEIIAIITLFVTCIPGVLFLVRLIFRRQWVRQQSTALALTMFDVVRANLSPLSF